MTVLRFRAWWIALGAAFVLAVVYLSLTPQPIDAGRLGGVKIGHFVAYGWLALWFAQLHASRRGRILVASGLALLGGALEYAQSLTGYRSFGYADMRDNVLGVLAGLVLAWTPLGRTIAALDASMARRRGL